MSSKLRIRIGEVEIDYEGTEEFLKEELPQLLKTAMELHKVAGSSPAANGGGARKDSFTSTLQAATTATIAARLKSKTGSDLLIAAAVRLTLISKKDTFTRQELLNEMQTASAYYKKTYSNNLSKYLATAVGENKLQETAANTFALSASHKEQVEKQLANA